MVVDLHSLIKMKNWLYFIVTCCLFPCGNTYYDWIYKSAHKIFGNELCEENIAPNMFELKSSLKNKLFGQNIVIDKLVPVLENHFKIEPKKALVICMHGWTGSGKNYATQLIIEHLYERKMDSEFVKMYNGRLHFPLDLPKYVEEYKLNLQNWIKGNVTKCQRSLFVFDEIDKMPAGIIDSIKPFFDYHHKIDSVNYRKSIFIFISNIGAQAINMRFKQLWAQGKSREDMTYKDFESILKTSLYKLEGGLKHSSVLEGHLVNLYLPFLPLGKNEIILCIKAELMRQNISVTNQYIDLALDELEFTSGMFSTSGCKRIEDIITGIKYKKIYDEL